ncbi:crotonase/enoyl-CoA hydratase family protein [Devosia sp. J2-20]|jgi:(methylthio)acryloyl-CoA hydratase|uniref:crotonase/enoyl-CoA hydratase family protein n=1 Tax=Devosia TaxID=46913 RepID=UPI0022AF3FF6|nr:MULTISPECIES: crotonase/enoyl-CoA hydratase family protein [Devosia]MCZ4346766.1 crotonase/enoyl-CoA hydratase family protein [Devosia neptuniae]WDR00494.1 crotonase/enoyl-CoA hydratase family protein [Devosia sp. J2-20]|tara:strand:- start:381 stop:1154 length:774 start_codon:yes stop_codon:yes gene_type:complete
MGQDGSVLQLRVEGAVAHLTFNRPAKRNAINDATIEALRAFFGAVPKGVRAVVLSGEGGHFSAGLDLSEQVRREPQEVMRHSRNWHAVMGLIQFSGVPVVAAMSGAVMGGGLEIASACHVRVAEPGAMFRMPEGQRGIFVGGGATVRLAAIIGADRLTEMMLTGRTYSAEEGERIGLAHYLAPANGALAKADELARQIATNSATVNYLIVQTISRIANMSAEDGLYAESLAAALSQTGADAEEGLQAFLEKRKPNFI